MRDVMADIDRWMARGESDIALATVIETWGSAPRKAGSKMAFTADGGISGSVSGGCVEGAVIEAGYEVLATGEPRLLSFGVADETAWQVGLACGGSIKVLVEPLDPTIFAFVRDAAAVGQTVSVLTVLPESAAAPDSRLARVAGGEQIGSLPDTWLNEAADLMDRTSWSTRATLTDGLDVFIDRIAPAPSLIMVGGAHIAVALARLAHILGYRTLVVDPRRAFGSAERFPDVDQLVHAWPAKAFESEPPTRESAIVTLSHDPKIDDPALIAALGSPAFYVGALGSRRTHAKRRERLAERGVADSELDRIHSPVGLDIGADNPEEIALAIMAEVVQAYRRR